MRKTLLIAAGLTLLAILAKSWIFALAVRPHLADASGVTMGLSLLLATPFVIVGGLIAVRARNWRQLLASALIAGMVGPFLLALVPGPGVVSLTQQLTYVARAWAATSVLTTLAGWILGASVMFAIWQRVTRERTGGSLGVV